MSERLSVGLIALALALTAFLGPSSSTDDAFVRWARHDLHLDDRASACVRRQLPADALGSSRSDMAQRNDLATRGLEAVPFDQRQLIGDIVVACVLSTAGPS